VTTPKAELSSLATALEELTRRLAAIADAAASEKNEQISTELYAVERALRAAHRRLAKLTAASARGH
jgi:ElaB/YqjD/DUF883 family membrane-anchored ribosome-binding protein